MQLKNQLLQKNELNENMWMCSYKCAAPGSSQQEINMISKQVRSIECDYVFFYVSETLTCFNCLTEFNSLNFIKIQSKQSAVSSMSEQSNRDRAKRKHKHTIHIHHFHRLYCLSLIKFEISICQYKHFGANQTIWLTTKPMPIFIDEWEWSMLV